MTALPARLRIVYRDYAIERWPANHSASANRLGECDTTNGIIRVCEDLNLDHEQYVLTHELLHALYAVGNLESKDEETVVGVLSALWMQVWRDNPELREYLNAV